MSEYIFGYSSKIFLMIESPNPLPNIFDALAIDTREALSITECIFVWIFSTVLSLMIIILSDFSV